MCAEFGQLGKQGSGNGLADAGNRGQQLLLLAPGRRAAHGLVDVGLEAGELLLQRGEQAGDALLQTRLGQALLPLPLGDDHLDDLPAAGDEIGQQPRLRIGQRPNLRLRRLDEVGDDAGVDRIGLGPLGRAPGRRRAPAPGSPPRPPAPRAARLAATTVS